MKHAYLLVLLATTIELFAQTSSSSNRNYITVTTYPNGKNVTSVPGLSGNELPNITAMKSVTFYDGLARETQSQTLSSDNTKVIASHKFYDSKGRLEIVTKPVEVTGTMDYLTESNFYSGGASGSYYPGDNKSFQKTTYLSESLNRVSQVTPFGAAFHNNNKFVATSYWTDPVNKLVITRTTDEDGNINEVHQDLFGNKVKQITDFLPNDIVTTFSYDVMGNLIKTLSPKFWEESTVVNNNQQDQLGYSSSTQTLTYTKPANTVSSSVHIWIQSINECGIEAYTGDSSRTAAYAKCCSWQLNWQYRIYTNGVAGSWQSLNGYSQFDINLSSDQTAVDIQKTSLTPVPISNCTGYPTVIMHLDGTATVSTESKHATTYQYNTLNQLTKKISPDEGTIDYVYNKAGQLRFVKDENHRTNFTYNGTRTYWTFYKYDELGRVIQQGEKTDDPSLSTIQSSVDGSPYVGSGSYPTSGAVTTVWNYYDSYTLTGAPSAHLSSSPAAEENYPKGRLTKSFIHDLHSNDYIEELYFYNQYGHLVRKQIYIPSLGTKEIRYFYDASGRALKMAYQSGQSDQFFQWYAYDNLSRLDSVFSSQSTGRPSTPDAVYDYDNNHGGKVSQMKLGNNIQTITNSYNIRDWLAQISSAAFSQTLKYYDATAGARYNGNIAQTNWTTQTQSGSQSGAYDFTYDKANRLLNAASTSGPNFSEVLTYDANGNINSLTRSTNPVMNYTYDTNKPNRLNSVSNGLTAAYTYDGNGNMLSDNTRGNFTYDYRNLPTQMNLTSTGNVVTIQNQTLSGTYSNSAGDSVSIKDVTVNTGSNVTIESRNAVRVQAGFQSNGATVSLKPGVSTAGSGGSSYTGNLFMTYDASGQRVKYLKGSASAPQDGSRIYVRGSDGKILAEYIRSGSNWNLDHYNLYGNGLVGKLNSSSQRYYYLADHLGSNRVILKDNSGTASVESWSDYYPFGKISRSSETANTPSEKFTGYQLDIESDLNYAGARYYNSVIGRFISVDPMHQYASGYVYSGNNPTRYFDPTGLWGTDFFADMGHSDEYIEQVLSAKRREIVCYWATAASEREIGNGRFAVEFQDNSDGG
ncbi:RHS repeat-associated core domain-containing protein, partial [bacterium]|nr:RHS repeat-associated core domain-containing protein [bacterium]